MCNKNSEQCRQTTSHVNPLSLEAHRLTRAGAPSCSYSGSHGWIEDVYSEKLTLASTEQ